MRRVVPTQGESHMTSGLMSVALSGVAEIHIEDCGISNAKDIGSERGTYTFKIVSGAHGCLP